MTSGTARNRNHRFDHTVALRRQAEDAILRQSEYPTENIEDLSPEDYRRTLHELHIHQIELEMQNEELRIAQIALDASRARYFDLYDLAPAGYCTIDEHRLILESNLAASNLLGPSRGDLVNQPFTRFIFPADQDRYYLHRKNLCATGSPQACELRILHGGSPVWTQVEASLEAHADKAPVCRVVILDINARKKAELALQESEAFSRATMDALSASLAILDENGTIIAVNRAWRAFASANAANPSLLESANYLAVCDGSRGPDSKEAAAFAAGIRSVLRKNLSEFSLEYPCHAPNEEGWFVGRVTPFPGEGPGRVVVAHENITERKRAEQALSRSHEELEHRVGERTEELRRINEELLTEVAERKRAEHALRQSEERLQRVMRGSNDAPWDWDLQNNTLYYSPRWWEILGYETDELPNDATLWQRLTHPDDQAPVDQFFRGALAHGPDTYEVEFRLLHKDGHYVPVLSRGAILRNSDGKAVRVSGTNTDLTGRKLLEAEKEKLEAQNRQLQKSESLGRMAGAVAHHFNNQLQVVMGGLELALSEVPQSAQEPIEFLKLAMQATRRASEVSSLMLTYLGQTHGKWEPVDLAELCLRNTPMLQATMPKNVALQTNLPVPGPNIQANPNQLRQVLTNLLTNAWEASDSSGGAEGLVRVSVATALPSDISESHRFPINAKIQDSAYACLAVTDTGCGIATKDIEKIFDPFYSSKFTGRGMGLSVVLGIVRAHHGIITIETEAGSGSTFRVYFPMIANEVARQSEKDKLTQFTEAQKQGTVLLVEDEDMIRQVAKVMLTNLGFTVLSAKDGVDAVEVFRQYEGKIRCVLCDLAMPRMNGWETLTALRELSPGLPVILASGYSKAQVLAGAHRERPEAILSKPYGTEQLREAITQALASKSAS